MDIQRGGPSTGLPTKTEQSDLLHAMYGRHGESPVPIVAAMTPSHCFDAALEAVRIAVTYRTPVFLLSDGYLANGSEPWRLPEVDTLPTIEPGFASAPNHERLTGSREFWPYLRDPSTLARPWAVPGTPGLEHRIGGLEKADGSGNVSYDGANHELMTRLRAAKVAGIAASIPPLEVDDVGRPRWRSCWCWAGGRPTAPSPPESSGAGPWAKGGSRPSGPPQPLPVEPGRGAESYAHVLVPEANLGQFVTSATGRVPS